MLCCRCWAARNLSAVCGFSGSRGFVFRPVPSHNRVAVRTCSQSKRQDALAWVAPENREEIARVVELAERAADRWDVTCTNFLTPPVVADAMAALSARADIVVLAWGGYPQAERSRVIMGREEVLGAAKEDPSSVGGIAAVDVHGNFMFDPATHRDFLGALLATGVTRDKVGDILVQGESGAQILVDETLLEYIQLNLKQVRTVPVEVQAIPLSKLRVKPAKVEEVTSFEASLRLDAVASAGFKVSRSKMLDLIKAGDVRINWRSGAKASTEVKAGDVISCSGKGRVEIKDVEMTKRERYALRMVRYV